MYLSCHVVLGNLQGMVVWLQRQQNNIGHLASSKILFLSKSVSAFVNKLIKA